MLVLSAAVLVLSEAVLLTVGCYRAVLVFSTLREIDSQYSVLISARIIIEPTRGAASMTSTIRGAKYYPRGKLSTNEGNPSFYRSLLFAIRNRA